MDLFEQDETRIADIAKQPLAARMRPQTLEEIVGQERILGPGKLLRRAIVADRLGSIILYGPPGCGKTTLAEVIARTTRRHFVRTSGVLANVAILRTHLESAQNRRRTSGTETILFIDEIHRFNKAQQDVLLPYVEDGSITLIGATTHNPFFFINTPLTSRSHVFQLEPLTESSCLILLRRALEHEKGLKAMKVEANVEALEHLAKVCEGDGRRALNALEIAALTTTRSDDGVVHVTQAVAEESIQKKAVVYDHDEDGHYDTISAFIKSVRGSDPNAALYWLAKMLYAGEDPRFVARRLVILASEDIGNADPRGLTLAVSAMEASDFVGMPEARIILAQATTYLASAPKSNASYLGIEAAMKDIENGRTLPVPRPLRSTGSKRAAKEFGHQGYQYAHNFEGHFVNQEYAPTSKIYYEPTDQGYEETIKKRIDNWNQLREKAREKMSANDDIQKKEDIRERIRSLRRGFEPVWMEQASQVIAEKVLALPQYEAAQVVGCFLSLRYEVRTDTLIEMCWKLGKRVCVPAMEKTSHDYSLAWLEAGEEIVQGPANIPQTKNIRPVQPTEVNLMIVPAMAFDRHGNRLGHGNGHFDRLLSKCPGYKIGLAFEAQIIDEMPVEAQDVSVDMVVTEKNLYPSANGRGRCR